MTPEQIYWLSLGLIIAGSIVLGFLIGRPYWFAQGKLEGIDTCSDIWREALDFEDDCQNCDDARCVGCDGETRLLWPDEISDSSLVTRPSSLPEDL